MLKKEQIIIVSETVEVLEYAYLNIAGNVNVVGIISNSIKENKFNLPVYDMDWLLNQDLENILIVIADNNEMNNVIKKLLSHDLQLIRNWIPYWMYNSCEISPEKMFNLVGGNKDRFKQAILEIKKTRQLVMIHGNCQTHGIRYYLKQNEEFADKYILIEMPQLWNLGHKTKYEQLLDLNIYSYVDILITQIISPNNRFGEYLATEYVTSLVDSTCRVIKIANLFFDGYYPQFKNFKKLDEITINKYLNQEGLKNYNGLIDYVVAEKVIEGKNVEEIIKYIMDEDIFDRKWLYDYIFDGIAYSKQKEEECDIKMCEYIECKLNDAILFTTNAHPCENLMVELCSRILGRLGIQENLVCLDGNMFAIGIPSTERFPIYPAIYKSLNLNDILNGLLYKLPNGKKANFREYMTVYIKTVFPSAR